MYEDRPPIDPYPLSEYVAWAGNRNREPILAVFKDKFPKTPAAVMEFASGSGMHINYFAPHFEHLKFQATDKDEDVFDNINKLRQEQGNDNIAEPLHLDLTNSETWLKPDMAGKFSAIFCINIFQVAPISIADGMMACAENCLNDDGILMIYGPFQVDGAFTTDSNQTFHETLRATGVDEWGLKDVRDLQQAAADYGLELKEKIDMPVNNFILVFGRK